MATTFPGVPGIEEVQNSLCHDGELYVPFGTMYATGSSLAGGMSMNFNEHDSGKTPREFLYKPTFVDELVSVREAHRLVKYNPSNSTNVIGPTYATNTTTAGFVGVEVGNIQAYFDVLEYAEDTPKPTIPTATEKRVTVMKRMTEGGWGIPLCMNEVPEACPVGTCKVAVNCINSEMLDSDHVAMWYGGKFVARTRLAEFGAERHLDEKDSGLSGGAIAGIAAGCVVVVAGVGVYAASVMGRSTAGYSSVLNFA